MLCSAIIPVYNSDKILKHTVKRTINFFSSNHIDYELILINDGSRDTSWDIIKSVAKDNADIIGVNLLKNYGQHNAVLCGMGIAKGDYIVTLDDDLQNPPEEILKLIQTAEKGHDLVFGKYARIKQSFVRRLGSKIINRLNYIIFNKPKDLIVSNFRLMRKEVAQRAIRYKTSSPYIQGLLLMFASNPANVVVEHNERAVGKSNYTVFKIISLVSTLLLNYTAIPIRLLGYVGISVSLLSLSIGVYIIIKNILIGTSVPGWASTNVLTSFLGGFIILMLSILGEYIGRLITEVSCKEPYIIKDVYNLQKIK
jgi:glycosyltransferase involved in cell wall biosynthesis